MYELLLEDYHQFVAQIRGISFQKIQNAFLQPSANDPLNKIITNYIPKLIEYPQDFDQHKKQKDELRKTPAFDRKRSFHNTDNLHRQLLDSFKSFLLTDLPSYRDYLKMTMDLDQLSTLLSRIELLRHNNNQFNLCYYLFTASKRSIRIYLKLRTEILKQTTFDKTKYHPISTHNAAKYAEKYHYFDKTLLSRKKQHWQQLANLAGFEYNDELAQILFDQRDEILAVELVQYCLWMNKQASQQNQNQNQSLSPTK